MNLFWKLRASLLSGLLLANAVVPTTAYSQSVAVNEAGDRKNKDNENDQASSFPSAKTIIGGFAAAAAAAWAVNFFANRPVAPKAAPQAGPADKNTAQDLPRLPSDRRKTSCSSCQSPSSLGEQQSAGEEPVVSMSTSATLGQSPVEPPQSPRDKPSEKGLGAAETTLAVGIAARAAVAALSPQRAEPPTLLQTIAVNADEEHVATPFFVGSDGEEEEMPPLEEYTPALPPLPAAPLPPANEEVIDHTFGSPPLRTVNTERQDAAQALQAEFTPVLNFPDATPVDSLRRAHEEDAQLDGVIQAALQQDANAEVVPTGDSDIVEFYADALAVEDRELVVKTPGTRVEFQIPEEEADGDDQDGDREQGPELIVVDADELDRDLLRRILEASKTPQGRTPRAPVQQEEVQEVQEPEEARNNAPVELTQQDAPPQVAVQEQVPQTAEKTKRARKPAATGRKTAAKLQMEEAERITATINTRTRIRVQRGNDGVEASTVGRARRGASAKTKDFGDVSKTLPFDEADLK